MSKNKKTILYTRVSLMTEHKMSPRMQLNKCISFCKIKDLKPYEEFKDLDMSGKDTQREQYQEMMRQVRSGLVGAIVVYKLDRVTRSVKDFVDFWDVLKKHGVEFYSVTESFDTTTPMGQAMLKLLIVFAELERELIAERITHSNQQRVADGVQLGNPPLGYERKKKGSSEWKIVPKEVKVVKKIFELYATDNYSFSGIARYLNERGYKTKKRQARKGIKRKDERALGGNEFNPIVVKNIIINPYYTGEAITYLRRKQVKKRQLVKGLKIIEPEVFEKCHLIREARIPKRNQPRRLTEMKEYPLRGCVFCLCGSKMTPRFRKAINRLTFECGNINHPQVKDKDGKIINQDMLFSSVVWYDQLRYEILKYLATGKLDKATKKKAINQFKQQATQKETIDLKLIDNLRAKVKRVNDVYMDGGISHKERETRLKEIDNTLKSLQKPEQHILTPDMIEGMETLIKSVDFNDLIPDDNQTRIDQLIKLMVKRVEWNKTYIKKLELYPEFKFFYPKSYKATTKQLRSAEMAKILGINQDMLRYYNKQGYLPALPISSSNFKLYDSEETKQRLKIIKNVGKGTWNHNQMERALAREGFEVRK